MVGKLCILIFILFPLRIFAQEDTRVNTDSSTIETSYDRGSNTIYVLNRLHSQHKSYCTIYYYYTHAIQETGIYVDDDCYGIWKQYRPNGTLKRTIDYSNGVISYFDKKAYRFYDYQNSIKLKGDSILKSRYSAEFFNKNIVWDIGNSIVYHGTLHGDWTDNLAKRPTGFLLRYKLKFDNKLYTKKIEFMLNSKGEFIPGEEIKGLEKLPINSPKEFSLTIDSAIALAKKKGLTETAANKANAFLIWQKVPDSNTEGNFRVYVTIKTDSIKDLHPESRSTVIDKYDVYVFSPWSCAFIEKKKMKTIRGWEARSGGSTGLLPDN